MQTSSWKRLVQPQIFEVHGSRKALSYQSLGSNTGAL